MPSRSDFLILGSLRRSYANSGDIVRRWRILTWIIIGWSIFMGALTGWAALHPGYPEALAFLWAIVVLPLGLVWYAQRPGVSRLRVAAAILAVLVLLWALSMLRPELPT